MRTGLNTFFKFAVFSFIFTVLVFFSITYSYASTSNTVQADYPSQTYKYSIELTIPKSKVRLIYPLNKIAKAKVSVSIPADHPGQELFIDSTSTKPAAMQFGQFYAQNQNLIFFVPIDKDQKISITGYEVISPINFDLLQNLKTNYQKVTIDQVQKYVLYKSPTSLVESDDPKIIAAAKQIKRDKTKISEIISATYDFVVNRIDYNYLSYDLINNGKFVKLQSAVETLDKGSGICGDYSRLMIALLRAQGIPARMVIGAVDTGQKIGKESPFHAWVQVYIPNVGFIDIDPTWGKDGNKYISDIDMNHVRLQFETPENQNIEAFTDYFAEFYFMDFNSWIYGLSEDQFLYSIKFTKVKGRLDTTDEENIRVLAPVFISPDGFVNPRKNTILYILSSIFLNPLFLLIGQIVLPLVIALLVFIFHRRKRK